MTAMGFTPYDGASRPEGAPAGADPSGVVVEEEPRMDAARAPETSQEAGATLSDRDRHILEFERQWWKYAGAKEQAIRDLFEMSGTRYYQILNGLIDDPQALAFDPMLVKRLRRMRATRQRARSARRLGIELEPR